MFVGCGSYRVREFDGVNRCFKGFFCGHFAKECKDAHQSCAKCGESGHLKSACSGSESCKNCKMKGLTELNHSVLSTACPVFKIMV